MTRASCQRLQDLSIETSVISGTLSTYILSTQRLILKHSLSGSFSRILTGQEGEASGLSGPLLGGVHFASKTPCSSQAPACQVGFQVALALQHPSNWHVCNKTRIY